MRHRTGDSTWAFAAATGRPRWTSAAFAVSILSLGFASLRSALDGDADKEIASALVASIGAIIVLVAQHQMGRAWRIGVRAGDTPLFVDRGLFRLSRNPVFVGMIVLGLGLAISAHDWLGWTAWLVFIASCHLQVAIEERHLMTSFGHAYREFHARVPRWIGLGDE